MANTIDSPYMGLPVPVPTVDPGPTWAVDLNDCLALIDSHNHSFGQGVQVSPDGLNINSDLDFQSQNITSPRSVRFDNNPAPLALVTDLNCEYVASGDLYFNDGAGNQVRITQSGSVAGASGTITGLPSGTASAAFVAANGTFVFQQATNTGANLDVASIAIRYPGSYPTPAGNYIQLQAPSSLASGYALTLPSLPAQTNVMTLGTTGTISSITYDAVGQGMTSTGANSIASSITSIGSSAANVIAAARTRATGTSVGIGGVAVSASSGFFSITGLSPVSVPGVAVTIITSGRPVFVGLMGIYGSLGPLGTNSYLESASSGTGTQSIFVLTDGTQIIQHEMQVLSAQLQHIPPSSVNGIFTPAAGTHTYSLSIFGNGAGTTTSVNDVSIYAYEL